MASSPQDAEQMMKDMCEESWNEVLTNQAVLKGHLTQCEPIGDSQDALPRIEELKMKCLEGEISAIKNRPVGVLPHDPVVLEAVLKDHLERCVSQLQECLLVVECRHKELEEHLAREEELLGQHQALHRAMESRLREAELGGDHPGPSADSQILAMKKKIKKAEEIKSKLLRDIAEFVRHHYPKPTAGKVGKEFFARFPSLLDVIELLMNKSLSKEVDPYLELDEKIWPPYIELLLRCGIASRHPQDCNRIRLVPFHL